MHISKVPPLRNFLSVRNFFLPLPCSGTPQNGRWFWSLWWLTQSSCLHRILSLNIHTPVLGRDSLTCCLISGFPAALAVSSSAGSEVGENESQQEGNEWGTRQERGSCVLKDVMFSFCFCVTMPVFSKFPSLRAFQLYRFELVREGRECSLIGCLANPPLT